MNHNELENRLEQLLKKWGLAMPPPLPSAGDYVGFVKTPLGEGQALVTISGQVPVAAGKLVCGKIGDDLTEADGIAAARLCGLALLAQLRVACDKDWSKVVRCVRLGGFVNAVPEFTNHPEVINGASAVMTALWGEQGKHARAAVGAGSLPRNVAVEVEAQFIIYDR